MANANQPNLTELMKKAQEMQNGMRHAQEELAKKEVEGTAGSDPVTVKIIINGQHEILRIAISKEAMAEGEEVVGDLVRAAYNAARKKLEGVQKQLMMDLTKKLGLPPDFQLPTGE